MNPNESGPFGDDGQPWRRCIDDPGGGNLALELGRGWEWRRDPFAASVSYRHPSGLRTTIDVDTSGRIDRAVAGALATALGVGVSCEVTGPVDVMCRWALVDGGKIIGDTWLVRAGRPHEPLT